MSQQLVIIAQWAMDDFYQNYRSYQDFFNLQDFIDRAGAVVGAIYKDEFDRLRAELRQERQDEAISFSGDWLSEQVLAVALQDGEMVAELQQKPMSFPFDNQNSGIQDVFAVKPPGVILERSNINEIWQYNYLPSTNRIFWRLDRSKLKFFSKGVCPLKEVRVLYAPTVSEDMEVPDGIIHAALTQTVLSMKGKAEGVVVKKALDGNDNKTLQTEVNKSQLK